MKVAKKGAVVRKTKAPVKKDWRMLYVKLDKDQFGKLVIQLRKLGIRAVPHSRLVDYLERIG